MMSFTFYSIGDSTFLEQILIGIAMITGAGDLEKAVMIGMLFGVLIICIKSLLQGAKQIEFQQILVCWICYMCFFGPASIVTIEDAYDGNVRVVANVPLGIGFTGGVISNVGYSITDLFTTGFSVIAPSITRTEFAESLKLLNDTRRNLDKSGIYVALNDSMGGGSVDVRKSWDNYIRECTLTKIDLGLISVESMMTGKVTEVMPFMSSLYGTRLYINPGSVDGDEYTCSDGWFAISSTLDSIADTRVQQAISSAIGLNRPDAGQAIPRIQDSIQALGQVSTSASEYLKASILEPLYNDAVVGKYKDILDFGSATMVSQAIQQRNTQWATEQSMFVTVARPMMAFFEGFVYALTPVMAMLMVMGSFGISMLMKYFLTVLWIQLWMPVLAVVNLYIHVVSTNKIAQLNLPGLDSFYAINTAGEILQNWIATGGMLAASTPIISLFIVTGSTYAFTSLAGRVNGSDHINEKINSPDVLQPGPLAQTMPTFSGNSASGMQKVGTESLLSNLNFGSSFNDSLSSSSANQKQTSEAFKQELGRTISDGTSSSQQYQMLQSLGRNISSSNTSQAQYINSKARDFSEKHGLDSQQTDAVRGAIAAQLTAGAGGKLGFLSSIFGGKNGATGGGNAALGGSAGATAEKSGQLSNSKSLAELNQLVSGVKFSEADTQALTNQLAHTASSSGTDSFAKQWSDIKSNNLSQTASSAISATEAYASMQQMANQLGTATNTDMKTLGGQFSESPDAMRKLNEAVMQSPSAVRQEALNLENRFRGYGLNPDVARSAAQISALTNRSNYGDSASFISGMKGAVGAVAEATGRNISGPSDYSRNESLRDAVPRGPDKDHVLQSVSGAPDVSDSKRNSVAAQAGRKPSGPSAVLTDNQNNRSSVVNKANSGFEEVRQKQMGGIMDRLASAPDSPSTAAKAIANMEGYGKIAGFLNKTSTDIASAELNNIDSAFTKMSKMTGAEAAEYSSSFMRDNSLSAAGNSLLGAAARGQHAFQEWASGKGTLSDGARGLSTEQLGAYLGQSLRAAAERGPEVAQKMINSNAELFKGQLKEVGVNQYGLTSSQASYLAASTVGDKNGIERYKNEVFNDFGTRTQNGYEIGLKEQMAFEGTIRTLDNAAQSGEAAGSVLQEVSAFNRFKKNELK